MKEKRRKNTYNKEINKYLYKKQKTEEVIEELGREKNEERRRRIPLIHPFSTNHTGVRVCVVCVYVFRAVSVECGEMVRTEGSRFTHNSSSCPLAHACLN